MTDYKWHDLRKNPEDLPDTNVYIEVAFYNPYTNIRMCEHGLYYGEGKWNLHEHGFVTDKDNKYCIGWKYIEPFNW